MKKESTAVLIILVAIITIIGSFFFLQETIPPGEENPDLSGEQETATQTPTPIRTLTTRAMVTTQETSPVTSANTIPHTSIPTTSPPTPNPTPTPAKRPVEFTLDSGTPAQCGLTCRETTATITNTGDEVAHSVCVLLEVFNENGERIFINSAPSIERCLGDIEGGSSKTETITIEADCGFLASKCIGHTLILRTRATSLEKTQMFPDSQIVV